MSSIATYTLQDGGPISDFFAIPQWQSVRIVVEFLGPPKWRFPVERFVEYSPSDEAWCRPLRIGQEVREVEKAIEAPCCFRDGGNLIVLNNYAIPSLDNIFTQPTSVERSE